MIFSTTASNVLITDSLTFLNGAAIFSIAPDTTTTISGSVIGLAAHYLKDLMLIIFIL